MTHTLIGIVFFFRKLNIENEKIASDEWLAHSPRTISGVNMKPFIVADSVFPLSSTCTKCCEVGQPGYRRSFNYSLMYTRRVVEQAFGGLKGRWNVLTKRPSVRQTNGSGVLCPAQYVQKTPVPI